jgi:hypothetical protein
MKNLFKLDKSFVVPLKVEARNFCLRALTIHDVVKDYDAVMTSRAHLWHRFGEVWGWPKENLSLEQDLIDLAWHQKEFELKNSFAYTVISPDQSKVLGCVYLYPASSDNLDAEVWFWARESELQSNLEEDIKVFLMAWLSSSWSFNRVSLNAQLVEIANR